MAICVFNPLWDPLRGDPRFEAIVASLAPKVVNKSSCADAAGSALVEAAVSAATI